MVFLSWVRGSCGFPGEVLESAGVAVADGSGYPVGVGAVVEGAGHGAGERVADGVGFAAVEELEGVAAFPGVLVAVAGGVGVGDAEFVAASEPVSESGVPVGAEGSLVECLVGEFGRFGLAVEVESGGERAVFGCGFPVADFSRARYSLSVL